MTPPTRPTAGPSLRREALRSLRWIVVMHAMRGALFFALPAVLANLTTADTIGATELVMAVFFVASQFIELGTGPAIIQRPQLDQVFLSTVFYVNLVTGLLFGGLLFVLSPWIGRRLHLEPGFARLLDWVAAGTVLFSLAIVQRSLLSRRLAFRSQAAVTTVAVFAAAAFAAVPVLRGRVAEGLVAGLVAFVSVTCAGYWVAGRWLPSLVFDRRQLLPLFRFSLSISAAKTLDNLSANWERFLVAGLLSPADLGLYALARNLHRTPLRHLMAVSDTVLMPALATIQADKARCRRFYAMATRLELAVLGPVLAYVAAFAPELVRLAYGRGWERVVPLVYLSIPVTLRVITAHTVGAVFLSQGRPDVQLRWILLQIVLMSSYALVGAPWGIEGVALSVAALGFTGWAVSHAMANRLINLPFAEFLRNLGAPAAAAIALTVLLVLGAHGLRQLGLPAPALLAAGAGLGLLLHAAVLRLAAPELLSELRLAAREAAAR